MDELHDFRSEVRDWLERNCPAEMRQPIVRDEDVPWGGRTFPWSDPQQRWRDAMVERGWTVPTWPKAYGGADLSPQEAAVITEEMRRISARPPVFSYGIAMLAPALMQFGSEEQKLEHLPPIARGEIRWCQGYSEPGAGSDLASLRTRADDCGDHFLVNGQKIWTSYADQSDWMFCLVRTDFDAPKHSGISFLLIDMTTPGVEARPIRLISGKSRFCETFFDNVVVSKRHLVGEPGKGWEIAKVLLSHERDVIGANEIETVTGSIGQHAIPLIGVDGAQRLREPVLRSEIAKLDLSAMAFEALVAEVRSGTGQGADLSSVLKYCGSEISKCRRDMLLKINGAAGLAWEWEDEGTGGAARAWLYSRADSIKGGTSEIQLNIIAKRLLGLPSA